MYHFYSLVIGMPWHGAWETHQLLKVPKKIKRMDFGELLEVSAIRHELRKYQRG